MRREECCLAHDNRTELLSSLDVLGSPCVEVLRAHRAKCASNPPPLLPHPSVLYKTHPFYQNKPIELVPCFRISTRDSYLPYILL